MKISMRLLAGVALLASPAFAAGHQAAAPSFHVVPMVSDKAGNAPNTDPQLKNPWGISQFPGGDLWVSDNHTDVSTIYDPVTGAKIRSS